MRRTNSSICETNKIVILPISRTSKKPKKMVPLSECSTYLKFILPRVDVIIPIYRNFLLDVLISAMFSENMRARTTTKRFVDILNFKTCLPHDTERTCFHRRSNNFNVKFK